MSSTYKTLQIQITTAKSAAAVHDVIIDAALNRSITEIEFVMIYKNALDRLHQFEPV